MLDFAPPNRASTNSQASTDLFTPVIQQRASWQGRMSRWLLGLAISVAVISSDALSQESFRDLESGSQFAQALRAVDAIKQRKKLQCVITTADEAACACLAEKLPVDTYVRSYVAIVKREKDGLDYAKLSVANKAIVDRCTTDGR